MALVTLTGYKELDEKMRRLPLVFSHKIIGSAIYKASKPIEDTAKSLIKDKTGNLKASVGRVRTPIAKANNIGEVKVGPRVGGKYKGYHGHLVELGTKNRPPGGWYARFPNAHTTSSKPHPFLEPALAREGQGVLNNIKNNIQRILDRYVRTGRIAEIDG